MDKTGIFNLKKTPLPEKASMLKSIGAYDEESVHFIANKAQILSLIHI